MPSLTRQMIDALLSSHVMVDDLREAVTRKLHPNLGRPRSAPAIRQFVVHHADGNVDLMAAWTYHMQSRGWDRGGYAVGVMPSGVVQVACDIEMVTYGAGAENNPKSIHVVALMDAETTEPTGPMLSALYRVLVTLDAVVGPRGWRGHQEVMPPHYTQCPGLHLMPHLRLMRGLRYGAKMPPTPNYP